MKNKPKNITHKKEESCENCVFCRAEENGDYDLFENFLNDIYGVGEFEEEGLEDKDDLYYSAMDMLSVGDFKSAEDLLLKAKAIDPQYVQTYVGLVSAYARFKDKTKREKCIKIAFEKTQKVFSKWPKELLWDVLENRAYLRAIQYRADLYWDEKDLKNAEELFRLLLKLNPNDNQGVRYEISAMLSGMEGKELSKMFEDGNKNQDWDKLEKLVKTQNAKYKFFKGSK